MPNVSQVSVATHLIYDVIFIDHFVTNVMSDGEKVSKYLENHCAFYISYIRATVHWHFIDSRCSQF